MLLFTEITTCDCKDGGEAKLEVEACTGDEKVEAAAEEVALVLVLVFIFSALVRVFRFLYSCNVCLSATSFNGLVSTLSMPARMHVSTFSDMALAVNANIGV